ncbi:MAG: glycoside hydrolase family 15 protein [Planctomycetes bacterium]|nr:glycoside hydrolase family 15 protein [Planctomycetota bacterium]
MRYGIIGNCAYSALLRDGAVEWLCWPRFDSSFVFGALLDREQGGSFRIEMPDARRVEQAYVDNTNVLRTTFCGEHGSFELLDFAPRFWQHERSFRPTALYRILRPLEGEPLVRVVCTPRGDYGRRQASTWVGSHHIEYRGLDAPLRLTTNLPLTWVQEGTPFVLSGPRHLALTHGQPLESPLEETAERFLTRTIEHWRDWIKQTRIPRDYQREVIRSALVLKLHQFEDTGAIIASSTTSLPEFRGSGRCWDYRYCWLRDAYFSLHAFERLGHFAEMEGFLGWLRNIVHRFGDGRLQPLYAVNGAADVREEVLEHLAGFEGERPVRIGNQAHEHIQNDVYGEMILAISRLLLDSRFVGVDGRDGIVALVARLLAQLEARLEEPDAGLWELRGSRQLHSFSLLAHWAGATRAAEIGAVCGDPVLTARAHAAAARAKEILETRCFDPRRGVFTQHAGAGHLDAAMLLALHFGMLDRKDPRAHTHVRAIQAQLQVDRLVRRYDVADDFGEQGATFTVCSFWLVEALAILGETDEARALFEFLLARHNGLGLYSEDIVPGTFELTGNFPQTYSHVGLINAAFRLSRPWD